MDPLRTMFRHHFWATLGLIDHCATLPPEQLQVSVPGTMGTIHATLVHLVAADQRYLERLDGQKADPRVYESQVPAPPLADVRAALAAQAERWESVLDRVGDLDVTLPARGDWPETPHAENLLLLQAVHHGNDHRTQICTILGATGLPVPDLDGWSYWLHLRSLPSSPAVLS